MVLAGDLELRQLSAAAIALAVNSGRLSAEEVVRAHLEAAQDARDLNAFITYAAEPALERARRRPSGTLAGVPLVPKDMFDTAGIATTRGSAVFAERVPRTTAWAVAQLEAAGAIVIGKANQHEFAWGVTSQNEWSGDVRNPVDATRTPGGSSGGNAAALAAGLCTIGLGTDTGGSVRIPSACCRTVGFKPSTGVISMRGCFPLAPTFDVVGPMTRSAADCALVYGILTGRHAPDARTQGLRVGVWRPLPEADWARWRSLGAKVQEIELPEPDADLTLIFQVEAAIVHRAIFPARRAKYGRDAQGKFDGARHISAVAYDAARRALRRWRAAAEQQLDVDLLVSPTLGMEIPPADVHEPAIREALGAYTRVLSHLGWAAIALGNLQIGGRRDEVVLGAAVAWEAAFGQGG